MPPYICFLCNFTSHTNRHTFRSNDNVFSAPVPGSGGPEPRYGAWTRSMKVGPRSMKTGPRSMKLGPRSMKTGPRSMKLGPPSMKMGPRSVQEYKGHTGRVRTPRFELAEIWQP